MVGVDIVGLQADTGLFVARRPTLGRRSELASFWPMTLLNPLEVDGPPRCERMRAMRERDLLSEEFERHRSRLRAVAFRMLGSLSEAEDAVQEAWPRLQRADVEQIDSLGAWLTTVVARICLNMLRSRRTRAEQPLDGLRPEPIVDDPAAGTDPEHEALLADAVGIALQVVLDTLSPAERLAFVLHDMFAVPFEEIATILERSPEAARQLASRARRRVRGAAPAADAALGAQRAVVEAFLAASRDGDFDALVAVLDPDVVLRADGGAAPGLSHRVQGAETVAGRALMFRRADLSIHHALVNGSPGLLSTRDGELFSVMGLTITGGRIAEMDILVDPERLRRLDVTIPGSEATTNHH
jgi:RNA polymerase sigma factor (sigma-70 family)